MKNSKGAEVRILYKVISERSGSQVTNFYVSDNVESVRKQAIRNNALVISIESLRPVNIVPEGF